MMDDDHGRAVRTLFKGGSILFVGLVLELGLSFFAKLLMAHLLDQISYGIATIGITVVSFVSQFTLLGLNTGTGRYLPRFNSEDSRRGVLTSGLQLIMIMSLLTAVLLWVFAEPISTDVLNAPGTVEIIRVAAIAIPFATAMKWATGVIQGLKVSVPKVLIRNILAPSTRFALVTVALVFGFGSIGVMWAYTGAFAIAGIAGIGYVATRTELVSRIRPRMMRRELLVFSLPLMFMSTMFITLSKFDILLLSRLGATTNVATYGVVYPLAELLTVTLSAFGFLFMPVLSELHGKDETEMMSRLYKVVTKWIFVLTLPVFLPLFLFPELSITLTFGKQYASGGLALGILALGFVTHSIAGPNYNLLTAIGRTRIIMLDNFVAVAVNIGLNLVLIPHYGVAGAAVATTISYLILNVLYSVQLYRSTGIHPVSESLVKPAVIGLIVIGILYRVARMVLPITASTMIGLLIVFVTIYGITVIRFGGIEEEEILLVLSVEERFDVDLSLMKNAVSRIIDL